MPITAASLRRLIVADGGFTVDMRTGFAPRCGICVCIHPQQSLQMQWTSWNDHAVRSWMQASMSRLGVFLGHLGGWHDRTTDVVHLDVVSVLPTLAREAACELGRSLQQRSVWDLERATLIEL